MFSFRDLSAPTRRPEPPTPRQLEEPSGRLKVTGKLAIALEVMVLRGFSREAAAAYAQLTDHGLYSALRKPHVKAHYYGLFEVLRTSAIARAHHRMVELSEQDDNKAAAYSATSRLLGDTDSQQASTRQVQGPGITIVIEQAAAAKVIEHEPE